MSEHISNNHCAEDDVIDLRELVEVIRKRKKIIFLITVIITALAVVYAFWIAKPVYGAKAMIEIGQIDTEPIDDIKNIQEKLIYEYHVNNRGKKLRFPRVTAITVPKGSNRLISIATQGYSNDDASRYIQTVTKKIEADYKKKTDAYIANQKKMIALVQQDIRDNTESLKKMQQELDSYGQKIISLKREDAALAGIYALQIGQKQTEVQRLKRYISSLKTQEQQLKLSITPLKMQPTQIAGKVEVLDAPIKPKKKLIVIVAFITGLMLSIFLAFVLEFLAKGKE